MRRGGQLARVVAFAMLMTLVLGLTAYKAEQNAGRRACFRERDVKLKMTVEPGEEVGITGDSHEWHENRR